VGLRKVVGASQRQLITQFFFDAFLINMLAALVAGVFIEIASGPFGRFVGFGFANGVFALAEVGISQWIRIILGFVAGILFVGAYPAMILSNFNPALVLKGKFYKSKVGITLRQSLVSFQYILAILLLSGSITIYKQLDFMRKEDLGYNKDQLLVVKGPSGGDSTAAERSIAFKNLLSDIPSIQAVSVSSDIPGKEVEGRNQVWSNHQTATDGFVTYQIAVDQDFVKTYVLKMLAGRNFNEQDKILSFDASEKAPIRIIVNELLSRQLGYSDPRSAINERIVFRIGDRNCNGEIVGVVRNHHQVSLRENFEPILYFFPGYQWAYFSIHFDPKEINQVLPSIRAKYAEAFPYSAFDFFFLDDHFDQQYRSDEQFGTLFSVFTAFAVLVATLGLTGLSIFIVSHRTKEVGIRKVLGASASLIILLFSRDFLKVLTLSYILVVPLIYFAATSWLENFSFRTPVSWEAFVAPPLILLTITMVTILSISLKAALASPVTALRQE
jgi:putative ABC transport system permease protein